MTEIKRVNRRHFLLGAGGASLAIPFLPSLLARSARAAVPSAQQQRLVVLSTTHGGIYPDNMLPQDATSMTTRALHPAVGTVPAQLARWGPLASTLSGNDRVISKTLTAPATQLTTRLMSKLNVMTGFDIAFYIGHNRSATLGNYSDNDQGTTIHGKHVMTVDQQVAGQPGFDKSPTVKRSVHYGWSNPWEVKNGLASRVPKASSPQVLWTQLFEMQQQGPAPRPLVIDRVHEHYRRLTQGVFGDATRLSRADKQRLEGHMQRLLELERQLKVSNSCGTVQKPASAQETINRQRQAADLIATAIICGATNVATLGVNGRDISEDVGWLNWHQEVAHGGCGQVNVHDPKMQAIAYRAQRRFFAEVFLYLVNQLDIAEGTGTTYLDNSLVYWSMESGVTTHNNISMPVVSAGSAAGCFETGRFIDYRNRDNKHLADIAAPFERPGVMLSRFHANVLQAFGVAPATYRKEMLRVQPTEFADPNAKGYGLKLHRGKQWGTDFNLAWLDHHFSSADDKLPGWFKGA